MTFGIIAAVAILALVLMALGYGYFLNLQRDSLKNEFARYAAELLSDKQNNLSKANAQSMQTLFTDLKVKLDKYEKEIKESREQNADMGTQMKAHISDLKEFANEARTYTAALIGGNKIQGCKGEEILAGLLKNSGLKEGVQFDMQFTDRESGARPDAVIYDIRNGHAIMVDAKMNIVDYLTAHNLPDDSAHKLEKARALKAHAASIKRQIDNLAAKDYAKSVKPKEGYENLPLVAMFCPFNAILESALDEDPSLMQYAYDRGIILTTPLTLWGYLWLVSWGWKQHGIESGYREIQNLAEDVLRAVDALVTDLEETGKNLKKTQDSFDRLYERATTDKGRMSVKRVASNLRDHGVTAKGTKRNIPVRVVHEEENFGILQNTK